MFGEAATPPRSGHNQSVRPTGTAISVTGLRHSYGDHEVVKGIDFDVRTGQVYAFLGPNGAGKTTTLEILEGYIKHTHGEVRVLDRDPNEPTARWREQIGIVLQSNRLQPKLTVRETLELFRGYYWDPWDVDYVLKLVGLTDQANQRVGKLSGGQQRRVDVGVGLIGRPRLLFLDEPTTGFDPAARRDAWEVIRGLRNTDTTVMLTTHYMEEAQQLADYVAILVDGEIAEVGTPEKIGGAIRNNTTISFRLASGISLADLPEALNRGNLVRRGDQVDLATSDPLRDLYLLTEWAGAAERVPLSVGQSAPPPKLRDLCVARPTLEDVYLALTADTNASVPAASGPTE